MKFIDMFALTYFCDEKNPTFCLPSRAHKSNYADPANANLVGIACWASFAVWKSNAG
jgi:hypothetical protein